MFGLRYTFTFTYISFHSCALQYIRANPFKALISCVHPHICTAVRTTNTTFTAWVG